MKGFFNSALVINLGQKSYRTTSIPDRVYENYLGGKGLGAYLLMRREKGAIHPFSAENDFILALGPASDTKIWGSSRYGVFTKSPLTGIFSESYSGGKAAAPMSRTGYDAIIIEGISPSPIFLEISDENVLFREAGTFWGLDTYESEEAIRAKTGAQDAGVLVIGPAGENMVRFASVVNDRWRCAGRTGAGAILGSKNVKGLVFHGNRTRETADPDGIEAFARFWREKGKTYPATAGYRRSGTAGLVAVINSVNAFPTRYWAEGTVEGWEDISSDALHSRFEVKQKACSRCFIACGRHTTVTEGRHAGLTIEGPEYETIYAFGGLCLITKLDEIIYLNDLCDRLGIDTITAGNLAAFAIEATRRGKAKIDVDYGDAERIAALLRKTAIRAGEGATLAEGIRHASRVWELEDLAVHVKGMEPGGYDPRVFKGMGLAYATSDRGACHIRCTMFRPELSGMIPPEQIEGKAEIFIDFEDRLVLQDALILCRFYRDAYQWDEMARIVSLTTGMEVSKERLRRIASNITSAVRLFNGEAGMTRQDDTLPARFFDEPLNSGRNTITRDELETMKDDYYRLRGWDGEGRVVDVPPCI